jgi:hypothetical protein
MIDPHADASLPSAPATPKQAAWIVGEPAMPDLLDDPLIHAVLRRDGLSLADLQVAITRARRRLAAPARQRAAPASDAA